MPEISVLLPVKNGEKYITESIDSVLNQTFTDFELLIFDDNSTDKTLEIIKSYKDPRIKLYIGKNGYIANLNKGIEIANGMYIARMDADDIMHPDRLESQLEVMENMDVDVCGSWLIIFGEGFDAYILNHGLSGYLDNMLHRLTRGNYIAHPSVMMRKDFLIKNNLRYVVYPYVEDYKLWFEIAKKKGIFYVVPKPLLFYRLSDEQVTRNNPEVQKQAANIRREVNEYIKSL